MFLRLALASLWSRKGSVMLTFLAITVSVFVLLGVEQIRQQAKNSFGNTVSGIDLIVGARTGEINLLLYSVFRLGNATNNISWRSYQTIAEDSNVAWTIPISLGDSHKGYRVMGTTVDYFTHFRYGKDKPLALAEGAPFSDLFDVVLGAEVAHSLAYQLGDRLVLSHGMGNTSFSNHDDSPFRVTGILKSTGTPVDRTLHVSLEGIEAIHQDWQGDSEVQGTAPDKAVSVSTKELAPKTLTAFMLGLKSKFDTFKLQRQINTYRGEPLLAILPGVTLGDGEHITTNFHVGSICIAIRTGRNVVGINQRTPARDRSDASDRCFPMVHIVTNIGRSGTGHLSSHRYSNFTARHCNRHAGRFSS